MSAVPRFDQYQKRRVENTGAQHHDADMSDMNREEVKARLEASEARVATSMETMRSDLGIGLAKIDIGLAKMDTTLAQILVAVEKGKSDRYAAGYKIITWSIATVVALAGLYKAFIPHT